jgi:peptidoglycan hydrolase-like protein with peptidoglycan-binding domain
MKRIQGLGGVVVFWLTLAISGAAQTDQEGAAQPDLRVTKTEILAVQSRLQERGYFGEKPDGKFDRTTRGALRLFQADQGLPVTSRIDLATLEKLGLSYPVKPETVPNTRRPGFFSKMTYGVADGTAATGRAIGGAATATGKGVKTGVNKTVGATTGAVDKTGDIAVDIGEATVGGVKDAKRGTQRAGRRVNDALIGRSDAEISTEVRALLDRDPQTAKMRFTVKDGVVKLMAGEDEEEALSKLRSKIGEIPGVKSVKLQSAATAEKD